MSLSGKYVERANQEWKHITHLWNSKLKKTHT